MFKICRTCKVEKLSTEFRKDRTQRDGRRTECKICSRQFHQTAYTIKYGEKARTNNRERYLEVSKKIANYKIGCGCLLCSEKEPSCLEFHHIDPAQKDFVLSGGSTRSWDKIEAEIKKCVVLCSNCHKKVHAGILKIESPIQNETS